eukprot:gene26360-32332_t
MVPYQAWINEQPLLSPPPPASPPPLPPPPMLDAALSTPYFANVTTSGWYYPGQPTTYDRFPPNSEFEHRARVLMSEPNLDLARGVSDGDFSLAFWTILPQYVHSSASGQMFMDGTFIPLTITFDNNFRWVVWGSMHNANNRRYVMFNLLKMCPGDQLNLVWAGYHNLQETASADCASDGLREVVGYQSSGYQQMFAFTDLAPNRKGLTRYYRCDIHCGATASRFEISMDEDCEHMNTTGDPVGAGLFDIPRPFKSTPVVLALSDAGLLTTDFRVVFDEERWLDQRNAASVLTEYEGFYSPDGGILRVFGCAAPPANKAYPYLIESPALVDPSDEQEANSVDEGNFVPDGNCVNLRFADDIYFHQELGVGYRHLLANGDQLIVYGTEMQSADGLTLLCSTLLVDADPLEQYMPHRVQVNADTGLAGYAYRFMTAPRNLTSVQLTLQQGEVTPRNVRVRLMDNGLHDNFADAESTKHEIDGNVLTVRFKSTLTRVILVSMRPNNADELRLRSMRVYETRASVAAPSAHTDLAFYASPLTSKFVLVGSKHARDHAGDLQPLDTGSTNSMGSFGN